MFDKSAPRRTWPPAAGTATRGRRWAVALALAVAAGAARSAPLTFGFEGRLTQDPYGTHQPGAPVSGHYTFESGSVDDIADPASGSYTSTGPGFGFSAVVDGIGYAAPGSLNIGTQAALPGLYLVTAQAGGLTLELVLQDPSGLAVAGDALPLAPPALSAFAVREFRLFADNAEFTATLDQLRLATPSVPEPGSAGLLLAGMAGVAGWLATRRLTAATFNNV